MKLRYFSVFYLVRDFFFFSLHAVLNQSVSWDSLNPFFFLFPFLFSSPTPFLFLSSFLALSWNLLWLPTACFGSWLLCWKPWAWTSLTQHSIFVQPLGTEVSPQRRAAVQHSGTEARLLWDSHRPWAGASSTFLMSSGHSSQANHLSQAQASSCLAQTYYSSLVSCLSLKSNIILQPIQGLAFMPQFAENSGKGRMSEFIVTS